VNPKDIVRDGYDEIASAYRPWADATGADTRRWFLSETLARISKGADVLELGCGPGSDAVRLAAHRRYTGVDISPVMLSIARERVPRGTFIEHDLTTLDLPEASFDAVVSLYVFGHLPAAEHQPTFEQAFRWLRPGGVLCASFPMGADDEVEEDWIGVPMFFGGIGREATERGLQQAGFTLEIAQQREDLDPDGGVEAFLWVIARRPAFS
jgi:ubiquinone/menaquinone biosynthesis C-methylase UbiE